MELVTGAERDELLRWVQAQRAELTAAPPTELADRAHVAYAAGYEAALDDLVDRLLDEPLTLDLTDGGRATTVTPVPVGHPAGR